MCLSGCSCLCDLHLRELRAWREIAFGANLATALAYFWIPAVMAVVFLRWREELPYRWLWVGFVLFISACASVT